jgi:transcriptional regulator with PAS, ATPase and Fis domain
MKMILVAPYEKFAEVFREVLGRHNAMNARAPYEAYEYELQCLVTDGPEELTTVELDCDVVMARGFTAEDLAARSSFLPIVEIPVDSMDLHASLLAAQKSFPGERVALLGSENMLIGVDRLTEMLGVAVEVAAFTTRDQIPSQIERLARLGLTVIIGGVMTSRVARERGLNAILLESGPEAMWRAICEAKKVAYISRKERERRNNLSAVLNQTNEGIVFLNRDHQIEVFNHAAAKMLGIPVNRALGKRIDQVIPADPVARFLSSSKESTDELVEFGSKHLAVNKGTVHILGDRAGTVLVFQDVSTIQKLESKVRSRLHSKGHTAKHTLDDIIGHSVAIRRAVTMARQFSRVDSTVLLAGETGTGKELFAHGIHSAGPRSEGPFVAVNCAALPESLLESELFGYVEGAFTGAAKGGKPGLFELAHGGTIFLDEISEMPLRLQGHLLRVIQEKEIMRLGHDRIIPVDVRAIVASNRDLNSLVDSGQFRADLYYRLMVLRIDLPPLRNRAEDIPLIVEHWIDRFAKEFQSPGASISDAALSALSEYEWPGNVRQVRSACEQLVVLNQNHMIEEQDIRAVMGEPICRTATGEERTDGSMYRPTRLGTGELAGDLAESVGKHERDRILDALELYAGNRTLAAESLGLSRTTLWRYMRKLGL